MKKNSFNFKDTFKEISTSRVFVTLWIVLALQALIMLVITIVKGHIGSPGIPVRYDGLSNTGIFLANGSYLLNLGAFAVLVPVLNIIISLKIYAVRGRQLALLVLWATVVIMLIATVFTLALLGLGNIR